MGRSVMRAAHRRLVACLALCSILFAAALPSFGHWLASKAGVAWTEICSATGLKRIPFDAGSGGEPADDRAGVHCPFCRPQDQQPAALPVHLFPIFFADARSEPPSVASALPPRLFPAWPAWQSRAPPAFS